MAARARVTLASVAAEAGVDVSLVSRVLRGQRAGERPETRERIIKAAADLGYRPNAVARSLRTATAGAYGIVVPDLSNPVYSAVIAGAEEEAARSDCVILVGSGAGGRPDEWLNTVANGRVDGLLVLGGDVSARILDETGVPWIMVNRRTAGAPRSLTVDDSGAARLAVEHLVALGHRRIAHVAGPAEADTALRRLAGFHSAMQDAGIEVPEATVVSGDYSSAGGSGAAETLLGSDVEFTAVVVANLTAALGVAHALQGAGRTIPDDVSVVAIHDADIAAFTQPPLTTVRLPLHEMGRRAIGLLRERGPEAEIHESVPGSPELIERRSTRPLV